eukprot:3583042-Prymnesium_polylepis.1
MSKKDLRSNFAVEHEQHSQQRGHSSQGPKAKPPPPRQPASQPAQARKKEKKPAAQPKPRKGTAVQRLTNGESKHCLHCQAASKKCQSSLGRACLQRTLKEVFAFDVAALQTHLRDFAGLPQQVEGMCNLCGRDELKKSHLNKSCCQSKGGEQCLTRCSALLKNTQHSADGS